LRRSTETPENQRAGEGGELFNSALLYGRFSNRPYPYSELARGRAFMAAKLNAEAFTVGRDLFFASERLNLSTPQGVPLLSSEFGVRSTESKDLLLTPYSDGRAESFPPLRTLHWQGGGALQTYVKPQVEQSEDSAKSLAQRDFELSWRDERSEISPGGESVTELTPIRPPPIQYAALQRNAMPLMGAESRPFDELRAGAVETAASSQTAAPPPSSSTTPSVDIHRLAEEVYAIIGRKLRSEKERRGYF
jgi:hypothetical protein